MKFLKSKLFNRAAIAREAEMSPQLLAHKVNEVQRERLTQTDIKKIEKVRVKMIKLLTNKLNNND